MLKKGRIAVACLAVATTAYWSWAGTSWQLQTKVGSTGGQIQVRNNAPQTTAGSISFSNFTTTNPVSVVVTANPGYTISGITENGSALAGVSGSGTQTVSFSKAASAQTLIANFVANQFSVTNSVSDAKLGAITASSTVKSGGSAVITAKPLFQNGVVTGITVNGTAITVPGVTLPSASPVTFTLSNITGNETVLASFAATTVSAGANEFASPGQTVTLNGSAQTVAGSTLAWSIVSAPAGSTAALVADATGLKPTFTPVTEGVYVFQLTESLGGTFMASSTTTLKVSSSFGSTMDYFRVSCNTCHNPNGAMATTAFNDFSSSTHWRNLRNNGDSAVAGDQGATCATNKCHFNSVNAPACFTCHSGDLKADGTFNSQAFDHTTQPQAKGANTCMICHSGSHHGGPTASYLKSSHYLNPYGEGVVDCQDCHNPHSTVATFPAYADATKGVPATFTAAGSCDSCHAGPYSIFNADGTMKTGHSASKLWTVKNVGSTTKGWYSGTRNVYLNVSSSYVTPNNSCQDCHGHNNQVNAEYAETMHGDTYGRWKGTDYWKFRGFSSANATTITHSNSATDGCVRCHTTTGFVNFVNTGFNDLRAFGFANTADPTSEVITCRACHNTTAGAINGEKTVALPEGPFNDGVAKDYNSSSIRMSTTPYPAYYNYSSKLTGKYINSVKGASSTVAVQFRDFKNSNVCIPCHSGRSGNATNGDVIKALASFSGFTTLGVTGGSVPGAPHGVYQASVLDAKIGYQFTKYTTAANGHATIGVGGVVATNTVSGPCVTCHMPDVSDGKTAATTHKRHSFDIRNSDGSVPTICSNCHSSSFGTADLDVAKANFQAAATALGEIMANPSLNKYNAVIVKYNPAISDGHGGSAPGYQLASATTHIVPQSLTPAQNADLVGIVYNLNLVYGMAYGTSEIGAYAHNPQYLKQLIYDSINNIRATSTGSVVFAISQIPAAAVAGQTAGFSAVQVTAATAALNNANNHYVAGATKVQYMSSTVTCTTCHNPNESDLQAAARVAWAESAHGVTTGPWVETTSSTGAYNGTAIIGTTDPCIRCHEADGFINFTQNGSFSNVGALTRSDAATVNTPLDCNVCHVSPLPSSNDRRQIAQSPARAAVFNGMSGVGTVAYYNYSGYDKNNKTVKLRSRVAASFPDVGDSNLCVTCHLGHGNVGQNLADVTSTPGFSFTNAKAITGASMSPVAGMMYNKAGFINFTSLSATVGTSTYKKSLMSVIDVAGGITSTHRNFGTKAMYGDSHSSALFGTKAVPVTGNLDQGGPCVTCHVRGNLVNGTARSDAGHSFDITQDAFVQVCANCHTSENGVSFAPDGTAAGNAAAFASFQANFLDPNAEVYQDAQTLIKYYLKKNFGIFYTGSGYGQGAMEASDATHKTAVTDWTRAAFMATQGKAPLTNAQATKLMGAVMNLGIFGNEPAAYAHARTYTRRLIYDTLDFLDDGVVNQSVGANAIAASQAPADPDFNVSGIYVKDTNAYNSASGAITTIYGNTSEAMIYLLGWSRSNGSWNSPERP